MLVLFLFNKCGNCNREIWSNLPRVTGGKWQKWNLNQAAEGETRGVGGEEEQEKKREEER